MIDRNTSSYGWPLPGRSSRGQAQRPLGDDVALDLVGAAVDRRRGREHQRGAEAAAVDTVGRREHAVGAEDVDAELRRADFTMRVCASLPRLAIAWPPPVLASALARCAFHWPSFVFGVQLARVAGARADRSCDPASPASAATSAKPTMRLPPGLRIASRRHRRGVRACRPSVPAPGSPRATPPAPMPERSKNSVVCVTAHPLPAPPMMSASCAHRVVEEDLVEDRVAGHLPQRPDRHARLVELEREPRDALVLRHREVGAGEQHPVVALARHAAPHLLAVDDPAVAVAFGARGEPARSEPAPGSLNSWHQLTWPARIGGTRRAICSGVPCVRIVGAAMSKPRPPGGRSAPNSRERGAHGVARGAVQAAPALLRGEVRRGPARVGDDAPPLVDRQLRIPVLLEPGEDLGPQLVVRRGHGRYGVASNVSLFVVLPDASRVRIDAPFEHDGDRERRELAVALERLVREQRHRLGRHREERGRDARGRGRIAASGPSSRARSRAPRRSPTPPDPGRPSACPARTAPRPRARAWQSGSVSSYTRVVGTMKPSNPPGIAFADGSVRQFVLLAALPSKPSVFSAFSVLTHSDVSPTTRNICAPCEIAACTCGVTSGVPERHRGRDEAESRLLEHRLADNLQLRGGGNVDVHDRDLLQAVVLRDLHRRGEDDERVGQDVRVRREQHARVGAGLDEERDLRRLEQLDDRRRVRGVPGQDRVDLRGDHLVRAVGRAGRRQVVFALDESRPAGPRRRRGVR